MSRPADNQVGWEIQGLCPGIGWINSILDEETHKLVVYPTKEEAEAMLAIIVGGEIEYRVYPSMGNPSLKEK